MRPVASTAAHLATPEEYPTFRVATAVSDMAVEMLELQAARASRPGISFRIETEWQHEFDASFPFKETPDQSTARR